MAQSFQYLPLPYALTTYSALNLYGQAAHVQSGHINRSLLMLDLIFLALGLGLFALFAGYAALCDRL